MTCEQPETSTFPEGDELLDRAVAAVRDSAIPSGPSGTLMQRTRAALKRQAQREHTARRRFVSRPAYLSLAAAIAILCASITVYRLAFHRSLPLIVKIEHPEHPAVPQIVPPSANRNPTHFQTPAPVPMVRLPQAPDRTEVTYAPGIITGRVLFDGFAPAPAPLPGVSLMPECQKEHGGPIYDESLVVNPNGTLANVVVSVSSGLAGWLREEFPPPAEPAVLNQKGCVFEPHVVALMVGEPLLIKNSDPFLHNVHVMAVNNPNPNLGQPTVGEAATEPFESPEVFRVKCDVHPWMSAWVRVLDNPYFAVTGRDGRFTLRGLPPGTYTLKAWQEQLGVREIQVTVGPSRGTGVDFTFKPIQ